jgi:hypothetical protein
MIYFHRSIVVIFLFILILTLPGCFGFQNDDPNIPEVVPIQEPIIYSYSKEFSELRGVLFKYDVNSKYFGIAFSHDADAPYGGIFFLGIQDALKYFASGDKVKLTGFIDEKQVTIWQKNKYYVITSIELNKESEVIYPQ